MSTDKPYTDKPAAGPPSANKPAADTSATAATPSPKAPQPEDVANALRFLHLCDARAQAKLSELSATVQALAETLIAKGQLPLDEYEKRKRLTIVRENERSAHDNPLRIHPMNNKYGMQGLPEIDCEARLPLCQARCCTMPVALSVEDLDERVIRWDYSKPYVIARGRDGYCVHCEQGRCSVYAQRPALCRGYDCRQDRRIWKDFAKRIPADFD